MPQCSISMMHWTNDTLAEVSRVSRCGPIVETEDGDVLRRVLVSDSQYQRRKTD